MKLFKVTYSRLSYHTSEYVHYIAAPSFAKAESVAVELLLEGVSVKEMSLLCEVLHSYQEKTEMPQKETIEVKRDCSICKGNGFLDVAKYDRVEQVDCGWCGTTGIEPQPPMPDKPIASVRRSNDYSTQRQPTNP